VLRHRDEGALAIIVALFAVVIFMLGALVVEAGSQREARRDAQNAADAGALAAAAVLSESGTRGAAVSAAAEYGVENNFPPGRTVANYFDGCTARVPAGWERSGRTSCVSFKPDGAGRWSAVQVVTPSLQTPRLFGAVRGPTRALAHATIRPGADVSPPVIFAGSQSCSDAVRWNRIDATGDIHSNDDLRVGTGTVRGYGTYRGSVSSPMSTTWTPVPNNPTNVAADEAPRAYPKTYSIADFRSGGRWRSAVIDAGGSTINRRWLSRNPSRRSPYLNGNTLRRGIYLTRGNITIDGTLTATGVTFVSDGGRIRFSGSGTKTLTPYAGDLQAFSNESGGCSTDGIEVRNSSRVVFNGVFYSPNARISIRDSATLQTSSGSLEGRTVQGRDSSSMVLGELPATIVGPPTLHLSK
jgi:Flp pilus assembly protein TadG